MCTSSNNCKMSIATNTCVYKNCYNTRLKNRKVRFYSFPMKDPERMEKWIVNTGNTRLRKLSLNDIQNNRLVCDKHFTQDSFINETRHRLVYNAVPIKYSDVRSLQETPSSSKPYSVITSPKYQFNKLKVEESFTNCSHTERDIFEDCNDITIIKHEIEENEMTELLIEETTVNTVENNIFVPKIKKQYRSGKCFVPHCTTRYNSKAGPRTVTLFSVPSDPALKMQWQEQIDRSDRELQNEDVVCEKHFAEEVITRGRKIGNVNYKYQRPRLKKDAVPTVFPKYNINLPETFTDEFTMKQPQIEHINMEQFQEEYKVEIVDTPSFAGSFDDEVTNNKNTEIFESLSQDLLTPFGWNLNRLENEDGIFTVFTQLRLCQFGPVVYKSLVIKEDLSCSIYYMEQKFQDVKICSVAEAKDTLRQMEEQNLCEGGPKTFEFIKKSWISEVATMDRKFKCWRHVNCKIVCERDSKCYNCINLSTF